MGYKQAKTIRLDFEELGDDCHVIIRNPMLMSQDELTPDLSIPVDENGRPLDMEKARLASVEVASRLVVSWVMWDIHDDSETPEILPVPAEDPTVMSKLPSVVVSALSSKAIEPLRPR